MTGPTLRQKVLVSNPQGFHLRPVAAFVTQVMKYPGEVYVFKGEERADGKSPFALLALGADQGTELTIEVSGEKAETVLQNLVEIFHARFPDPE
jgi:phosphotransferase system HPr (HPr) family protein